jgi:hypothetical protein
MRLTTALALGLWTALPAPIAASAPVVATKQRIQMHPAVYGPFSPALTALAPLFATVRGAPSPKADVDKYDGLSRRSRDCNYGCLDH